MILPRVGERLCSRTEVSTALNIHLSVYRRVLVTNNSYGNHNARQAALVLVALQKGFDEVDYWGNRNNPEAEDNAGKLLRIWREKDGLYSIYNIHLPSLTLLCNEEKKDMNLKRK